MKIRPKHFPYPIVTPFDTEEHTFLCELEMEEDAEFELLRFKVNYIMKNKTIKSLIDQGLAVYGLHIECVSTMKRILFTTEREQDEFEVSINDLNKTVDINYFVLADAKIINYENSELDPFAADFSFELDRGDLLAIGPAETLEIDKDPLIEVNSIFELVPTTDKSARPIQIDLAHNSKIIIQLPKDSFDQVLYLHENNSSEADSILVAIYYIPALVEALYYIRNAYQTNDDTTIEEIRDTAWYKSIEVRLSALNIDITKLPEENLIGISHDIMKNPSKQAMDTLQLLLEGGDYEDETF